MEKIKIADLDIGYEDVLNSVVALKAKIDELRASTKSLQKEQEILEMVGKKDSDQYRENAKVIETNNIFLKGLTSEYQNNQKVLVSGIAAKKEEIGTLTKLEARNRELRASLKGLNLETTEGRKKQKEYIAEINRNTEEIKKNSDAAVQQKMNIGNYKSALDALPPSLQNGVRGFQSLTAAAKVFLANPIVLAITAIVGAVAALVASFKRTEEGGDKVKRIIDQVKASIAVITDRIQNFSLVLDKIFSGEAKLRDLKGIFKGIGDEIKRDAEQAGLLADMMDRLEDKEIDLIVVSAERTAQIAKLMELSSDQTKSEQERIAALAKAKQLMEEEAAAQQKVVLTRVANELGMTDEAKALERINQLRHEGKQLALEEIGLSNSTNEDRKRVNELIAQYINLEEDAARQKRRTVSTMSGLVKQQVEAEKKKNAEIELENQKHANELIKIHVDQLNAEIEYEKAHLEGIRETRLSYDMETQRMIYEMRVASNEDLFNAERQMLEAEKAAELSNADLTGAQRFLIEKKYSAYMRNLKREEINANLSVYGSFASSLAQLFGENTKIGRIAAVTSTVIDTYKGAMSAFAETPGGIIIKSAAAATAVVAGMASVKKILSTKSGLPGDSSVSAPSMSAASVPGVPATSSAFDPTSPGYSMAQAISTQQPVLVLEDFQTAQGRANQVRVSAAL